MPHNITIIGLGQLGGAFALACQHAGIDAHISGYDSDPDHAQFILETGAVHTIYPNLAEAVAQADIILLAIPLRSYDDVARAIAPHVSKHAVITDVGSVKHPMLRGAAALPQHTVIPGHPIAGGEKSGPHAAVAHLFNRALCVLTPSETASQEARETIAALWDALGCTVMEMPLALHDQIYAHVSHLPHLVAFAAAETLFQLGVHAEAKEETLHQFLRISRSDARMWCDIFIENADALLPALATYLTVLRHIHGELTNASTPDAPSLSANALAKLALPNVLAASMISTVSLYEQHAGISVRKFAASGLRDIAAPAAHDPEGDLPIISAHAKQVAAILKNAIAALETLQHAIESQEENVLYTLLGTYRQHAFDLVAVKN
jgi:cyclohexadieny/prephenate dehydrogenase